MKPVLISGIQPSGRLHIGNYLGALKNFVDLQNSGKYHCYFFIADLHALTENPTAKDLSANILNLAADFLAAGIVAKKATIFLQSQVSAHTELAWIFETITPEGELRRMTQYKDKALAQKQDINLGLLSYPALMAADILLYDTKFVPVGHDQLQHLELSRTLSRKFNNRYGKTFIEPQPILTKTPRVMSLDDPTKKMSKSRPQGCLFIDDSPEEIKHKIGRAVTDSGKEIKYDQKNKPAISNLLGIYSALNDGSTWLTASKSMSECEKHFSGKTYAEFKNELADLVSDYFADFRAKKQKLIANRKGLIEILKDGSKKATAVAEKKIQEVKKKIGVAIYFS